MIQKLPHQIKELVLKFKEHYERYKDTNYNETQTRREFIDPFFKELGWDIDNTGGFAESYKEVIHEDRVKIGSNTKSPDYSFRVGGQRKFFVEAKKPSVDLKNSKDAVFQLRRYGWTAGLTLCILTDFEEFCVYQTNNIKPDKDDNPTKGRIFYCRFDELENKCTQIDGFETNWDFIIGTFTKEAILKGRFDKLADKKKKSQETFDEAFLKSIQEYRKILAENIVLRNKSILFETKEIEILKEKHLNEVVRKTIDRLIFLRIAEDRGVEEFEQLSRIAKGKSVYKSLLYLFNTSDQKYNAGLFDSKDDISHKITIDDKPLKTIISELYDTYSFEFVPLDILGSIYERFLGDTIGFERGKPVIETKPEVRKAGGVYYTPEYIVQYIVQYTVDEMLKNHTLKTVVNFRIVDPACGSGAFLIIAYEHVMKWYIAQYTKEKSHKFIYKNEKGEFSLTLEARKRILKEHIFGVDIDFQAVEVAKLSLLIKCLEGMSKENIESHNMLFHERALPNINSNIKCGNSLIGTDYKAAELFGMEEAIKVNPFDWQAEFPQAFKDGGFDCVIGNPPYIRIQTLGLQEGVIEYFNTKYKSAIKGNYDIYVLFIEKALTLLKKKGINGFILPHKFVNAEYGVGIRECISNQQALRHIVHFGDLQIFNQATTYTCLLFLQQNNSKVSFVKIKNLDDFKEGTFTLTDTPNITFAKSTWQFNDSNTSAIMEKMKQNSKPLGEIADIFVGIQTSADKVFIMDLVSESKKTYIVKSKATNEQFEIEKDLCKPVLKGSEIKAYKITTPKNIILFPYKNGKLIQFEQIVKLPLTYNYLIKNKAFLEARENGKFKNTWWQFGRNQNIDRMDKEKIILSVLANKSAFSFDNIGEYCFVGGGNAGGYGIILNHTEFKSTFVLALLNSKLLDFAVKKASTEFQGGYFSYAKRFIEHLPIPISTAEQQAKLTELAQKMLDMNKRLSETQSSIEKQTIERQIAGTDNLINQMVYALYGLSEEEIGVVERLVL